MILKEVVIKVLDTAPQIMSVILCFCSLHQTTSLWALQNSQILTPYSPVQILTFLNNCIGTNALIPYYSLQM